MVLYTDIKKNGVIQATRTILDFLPPFEVTDDAGGDRLKFELPTVVYRVGSLEDPAPAPSLTISGLDGNTHKIYHVKACIKISADGGIGLRINGDSGNNYEYHVTPDSLSFQDNLSASYMQLTWYTTGFSVEANSFAILDFMIYAKTGVNREVGGAARYEQADGSSGASLGFKNKYKETATNLTSITFLAENGNLGGTGTYIRVYVEP